MEQVASLRVHTGAALQFVGSDSDEPQKLKQLYAAYTLVYDVHSKATQLLAEGMTLFAAQYPPTEKTVKASASSTPCNEVGQRRDAVEDLLLRFTDMQAKLMPASSTSCTNTESSGRGGGGGKAQSGAAVHEAVQLLEKFVPEDWREAMQLSDSQVGAPAVEQKAVATRSDMTTLSHPLVHGAAAPEVLSWPADVVQLALLFRRHWTLRRDIALSIPAILDILASMRKEGDMSNATHKGGQRNAPPLSVVVALTALQLCYAPETLETEQPSKDKEFIYTPAEQRLMRSSLQPLLASASMTALTMLPLFLWQAWVEGINDSAAGPGKQQHQIASSASQTESHGGSSGEARSLHTSSVAAAAHGYATARAATKQLYKWEARIAAYVSAQILLFQSSPRSDDSSCRSASLIEADASFLALVQAEMSVLRGACNATLLLWLTIGSFLHPLPSAPPVTAQQRQPVLADVLKRCTKLEKVLRSLWSSTTTARLLLPGTLLWLGYATGERDRAEHQPPGQQSSSHWLEAYAQGQRVLGRSHPFVEQLASLLPHSATTATAPLPQRIQQPQEAKELSTSWTADTEGRHTKAAATASAAAPSCGVATPLIPTQLPICVSSQASLPQSALSSSLRPMPLPPALQLAKLPARNASAPGQHPCLSSSPPRIPISVNPNISGSASPVGAGMMPRPPAFARTFTADISSAPPPPPLTGAFPSALRARPPPTPLKPMAGQQQRSIGHVGVAAALRSTYPPSHPFLLSADAAAALPSTAVTIPQPPLKQSGGQAPPKRAHGLSALRNCHRLHSPAEALQLVSSVREAVIEDEAAQKEAAARRKEKRKKKNKKKVSTTPTEALLLSANPGSSMSSLSSTLFGSSTEHLRQKPRRRRPDRQLLPPLAEVRRAVTNEARPADSLTPSTDKLSPYAQGGADPFWSGSVNDGAPFVAGSAQSSQRDRASSSVNDGAPFVDGSAQGSQRERASGNRDLKGSEDEEDDEEAEYVSETLPERNARLQREIRSYFAQLNDRRVHAAAVIQRAWRCSRARQILQVRQQVLYRYVYTIQKAAALAMEGFMMCVMAKRKRCVVLNTRAEDDAQRQLLERRQVAAAQVLTRAVRQWCQRQRDRQRLRKQLNLERDARLKQYEITAVTVQRWWRVIQPQKAYWRRRTTEVEHERRQRAEAERIARAATTIQKRVRGVQARARVDELKRARAAEARALRLKRDAAVTVLTIVLQEHVLRQARIAREAAEQQVRQEGAVQRIAEGWKSTLARRRMDVALQRARQLRTSATCIQRVWKRYFAGRQRRYLRQIRRTVEEERLARELHLYTSVVLVQCAVRGAQDELLVRRLRARVGRTFMESLFLVQAVLRAGQARQALGQARLVEHARRRAEAAALEQRRLHAVCLVQAMVRAHRSAYAAQKRRQHQLEEKLHVHSTAAREMREDAAATVVQRAFRRHQQRQRTAAADAEAAAALQYLHKVARCIQQAWRAYAARQERRLRAAAVERCSRKRQEQEEVMELIWRDQKKELDMLYTLEFHYIAEAEHAARIALYQKWTHPSDWASATQSEEQWNRRSDDEVARWAEIYVD